MTTAMFGRKTTIYVTERQKIKENQCNRNWSTHAARSASERLNSHCFNMVASALDVGKGKWWLLWYVVCLCCAVVEMMCVANADNGWWFLGERSTRLQQRCLRVGRYVLLSQLCIVIAVWILLVTILLVGISSTNICFIIVSYICAIKQIMWLWYIDCKSTNSTNRCRRYWSTKCGHTSECWCHTVAIVNSDCLDSGELMCWRDSQPNCLFVGLESII